MVIVDRSYDSCNSIAAYAGVICVEAKIFLMNVLMITNLVE